MSSPDSPHRCSPFDPSHVHSTPRILSAGFTFVGIFHSNFGRLAAELQYAKGFTRSAYVFADLASCRAQGHYHPDRDSYFDASAPWYLPLRAARVAAGLPPGLFV